jgi:hypothetical protein
VRDGELHNEEYWQFMRLQAEQFVAFWGVACPAC